MPVRFQINSREFLYGLHEKFSPFQWFYVSESSPCPSPSTVLSITSTPIVCVVLTRQSINWVLLMPAFWSVSFWLERACSQSVDSLELKATSDHFVYWHWGCVFFFAVSALCNKAVCYWNAVKTPQFMWKKILFLCLLCFFQQVQKQYLSEWIHHQFHHYKNDFFRTFLMSVIWVQIRGRAQWWQMMRCSRHYQFIVIFTRRLLFAASCEKVFIGSKWSSVLWSGEAD